MNRRSIAQPAWLPLLFTSACIRSGSPPAETASVSERPAPGGTQRAGDTRGTGEPRIAGDSDGVFVLTPRGASIPARLLEHPDVQGIVLRTTWPMVQPDAKTYDWAALDGELDRVAASGKRASIVVSMGGLDTPAWLRPSLASFVTLVDPNPHHDTHGQALTMPVFWDPALQRAKLSLIRSLGEHLSGRPEVVLVSAQCANATTDDWNLLAEGPDAVARWQAAGFDEDKLLAACTELTLATLDAFPRQQVHVAVGRVPAPLTAMGNPDRLARTLLARADEHAPGRLIAQRHNISPRTPKPDTARLHGWSVLRDRSPDVAFQFLWPATDTRTCRLAGTRPCDVKDAFVRTIDVALAYRPRYIEIYGSDLLESELAPEIHRLAVRLRSDATAVAASPPTSRPVDVAETSQAPPEACCAGGPASRRPTGGQVERPSFLGPVTRREVSFSIYLPPDAAADPSRRFPVIYWLHGKGGDDQRSVHVARYLEAAVAAGVIEPSIMVFPNGGENSFYTDRPDGTWPVETMILEDLIPYVDAHFPTRATPASRALMGFSMGGFGALKFAALHPSRFAAVVAYAAPRTDARLGMGGQDRSIFETVFKGDATVFERNTPAYLFERNAVDVKRSGLAVRLVAGSSDGTRFSMQRMNEVLEQLHIDHEFDELTGVPHAVGPYYDSEQGRGFAFLGAAFRRGTASR